MVDVATGQCAVYEYDSVGNILSIARQANCVTTPVITSISPAATPNCFVVTGQNLLGATVSVDIPGVSITGLTATDTSVSFCLSTQAPVCSVSGTVTVTTLGGSSAALPVTISGAAELGAGASIVGSIEALGEADRFCFALPTQERVVLQATSSAMAPCLRLLAGENGPPVPDGAVCAFPAARLDLVLAPGTYFLDVFGNFNNQTGAYTLLYEPIVASAAVLLVPDVPASEAVDPVGDVDLYTFTLTTSTRVVLQGTSSMTDPCLRVLTDVSGPPVTGGTACGFPAARLDLVLAAGTYFVEVSDNFNNQTGAYNLLYQPIVLSTAVPLVPDVPASETINPLGDLDLYTFTLTTPTRVVLQGTSTGTDPCLRVLTGAGDAPVTGGLGCGFPASRLDLVLAAGTYFVEVSDNGNNQTGAYTLLYQPVVLSTAVPLVPDVPASETMNPLGDLDLYTFTLTTPTRVVLQGTSTATDPCLRVLTGAGDAPVTGGLGCGFPAARLDLVLAAGTYFVEVSDNGNNQTGAYTLLYQPVVLSTAVPLVPDVPASETINPLGDLDLYTFTLTTPTRVVLQGTSTATDPCLRVLTAAGDVPVSGGTACAFPAARLDLVLAAGTYFVEVSDNGNSQTGAYTLLYQPVVLSTAVPLVPDVPASETINPLGDLDLYTFTLTTPTRVVLQGTSTATDPCLRVLTGAGDAPVTGGTACAFPAARLDLVLAAGTYFVEVSDASNNQTGAYTLLYQPVVTSTAVPLVPDMPASETVSPLGDLDLFTFTLAISTRVVLQATSTSFGPCIRLLTGPGGPPLTVPATCGFPARFESELTPGRYFVEVSDASGLGVGNYTLLLETDDSGLPTVALSVSDADASELGSDAGSFTITRTGIPAASLAVNITVAGTADSFVDYQNIGTTVIIPAGQGSVVVPITPFQDFEAESSETVILTLAAGNYTIGTPSTGTVTIADNVAPTVVSVSAFTPPASETPLEAGAFEIFRFGPLDISLTVNFALTGTATEGADFETVGSSIVMAPGVSFAPVTITPIPDGNVEGEETVTLALAPGNYTIADGSGTASLTIGDAPSPATVSVQVTLPTVFEGGGSTPAILTVIRIGSTADSLTVNLQWGGTAERGIDYNDVDSTLVIPAGELFASIVVGAIEDAIDEGQETVTLTIAPGAYSIDGTSGAATVTIIDGPERNLVYVLPLDAHASEAGSDIGEFAILRIGMVETSFTINYELTGTASNGVDYQNIPSSVVIPADEVFIRVLVQPITDAVVEGSETVTLTLAPGDYVVLDQLKSATITLSDGTP